MPTTVPSVRTCHFGPVAVRYDARVLAPRLWTLAQSVWAAEFACARSDAAPILELCAGAGQIGLAAAVLADRDLVQVEVDPVAAGFAAANARYAGWGARVEVRVEAMRDALRADETFPVIVADPPYVTSDAVGRWPEDPVLAIDGGPDGLDLIRTCLDLAAGHLSDGGCLLLQVAGQRQAEQVARLAPGCALRAAELRAVDAERAVLRVDRR